MRMHPGWPGPLEHQLPCSFLGPSCARGSPEMWTVGPTGPAGWAGWRDVFEQLLPFWAAGAGMAQWFPGMVHTDEPGGRDDLASVSLVFGKQRVEGSLEAMRVW